MTRDVQSYTGSVKKMAILGLLLALTELPGVQVLNRGEVLSDVAQAAEQPEMIQGEQEEVGGSSPGGGTIIWGNIQFYTDDFIVVNGRRYDFAKTVSIDTFSLQKDRRGNVRVLLDAQGRAIEVFFFGIDMPDVFKQYKRSRR